MIFKQYGRSLHLKIETADDLESVVKLDEAHWVATGAPVDSMSCDRTFLRLLDTDNSGRILCHEVRDAINWLLGLLRDRTEISSRSKVLYLDAVDPDTPEGQKILDAARKALRKLGERDAPQASLEQVRHVKAQLEATPVSEVGVVLPEAATDAEVRRFIADIIETVGGTAHPSGSQGIGSAQLTVFVEQASAYLNWYEQGQIPTGQDKTDIMPLGTETSDAFASFAAIRDKIDQYFAQCVALALDERFSQRMGWTESEVQQLDFDDPAVIEEVLRKAPLAKARPFQSLDFSDKINPYYATALEDFRQRVVRPVLGESGTTLSVEQWQEIKAFFAAHQQWLASKAGAAVEPLEIEKLRLYLDERFANAVRTLISNSARTALALDKIRLLEKLILYQAYMIDFVNNFVSFPDLYSTASRAMFEMGSLVMDGRRFNLSVPTVNRSEHKSVAGNSYMYVLYVEIAPREGDKMQVVVPVTSGGKGNLCIGKRGVFYDTEGREYDARVVDVIENPISFREALLSPFQRLGRLVVGKIESITTTAEEKLDSAASSAVGQATAQLAPPSSQTQQAGVSRAGLLMGAGVTVAALGSSLAYITKTLTAIHPWRILAGVVGAVFAVMIPISVVAFVKLRRRDLSAILEGSGWGINARMRLTRQQSRFFTERPEYPEGAKGIHYFPWRLLLILILLLAVFFAGLYLLQRRPIMSQSPQGSPKSNSQPSQMPQAPPQTN
jgi:hypothetical protein